jgi:two-component system chemotaxis response regulator CheB
VTQRKIKVLIVDDSAVVRRILSEAVSKEPDLEVVGLAPDPFVARNQILKLKPDVVTLDIEMPGMDGLSFLKKLMHYHPLPVIIISSLGQASSQVALEALRCGAVEVLAKPSGEYSVGDIGLVLANKIRAAFSAKLRRVSDLPSTASPAVQTSSFPRNCLVAIGASTGGTQAIEALLLQLPEQCPPILIVQHIPPVFSAGFAARLSSLCKFEVKEAKDADLVKPGRALVAPGDFHMTLRNIEGVCKVAVRGGPRVHYHRPSVDVLFQSIANAGLTNVVGVLLTGMGSDGAEGLLHMRQRGATTIAQDEATCVVFGMPKAAIDRGAAQQVLSLSRIPAAIFRALDTRKESTLATADPIALPVR